MFRTLSAAALSVTLALATAAPTTARAAGNGDLARLLLGAGLIAAIATAVRAERQRNEAVTRQQSLPPAFQPQWHEQYFREPPRQSRRTHRVLPQRCERYVETRTGTQSVLGERCLEASGVDIARLPQSCEQRLDLPGRRGGEFGFGSRCLQRAGYTIH